MSLWGQPTELEAGDSVCLRNGRGLWKDHPCLTSAPKAKGAADGKRGRAGCSSPSLSSSTSLKPPLSFDSRGLLINLPALKGQTGSTESRLTCAPAHTRRGAQMPLPPRSPSKQLPQLAQAAFSIAAGRETTDHIILYLAERGQ